MADDDPRRMLDWEGSASPPRRNGELVFATLWESRLFGLTMALFEGGGFRWDEFRARLIVEIGAWEREHGVQAADFRYYDCWLAAFERLLADKGLCPADVLAARVDTLAARPPGHDHAPRRA